MWISESEGLHRIISASVRDTLDAGQGNDDGRRAAPRQDQTPARIINPRSVSQAAKQARWR